MGHAMLEASFVDDVSRGLRYRFGENWARFLSTLDEHRLAHAQASLQALLGVESLSGKLFMDIGSGSGLFSLAARRLGAEVVSFDFDPQSVACTASLRERFFPGDLHWSVFSGSVLDPEFMAGLPLADLVYAWGVLHHTGRMHQAIDMAAQRVKPGGRLCLALYRKTVWCGLWKIEKRFYSRASAKTQALLRSVWVGKTRWAYWLRGRNFDAMVANYPGTSMRGMDYTRDVDDWLGGYPYESITPAACRGWVGRLGFDLVKERARSQGIDFSISSGCDEWLFQRREHTTGAVQDLPAVLP